MNVMSDRSPNYGRGSILLNYIFPHYSLSLSLSLSVSFTISQVELRMVIHIYIHLLLGDSNKLQMTRLNTQLMHIKAQEYKKIKQITYCTDRRNNNYMNVYNGLLAAYKY